MNTHPFAALLVSTLLPLAACTTPSPTASSESCPAVCISRINSCISGAPAEAVAAQCNTFCATPRDLVCLQEVSCSALNADANVCSRTAPANDSGVVTPSDAGQIVDSRDASTPPVDAQSRPDASTANDGWTITARPESSDLRQVGPDLHKSWAGRASWSPAYPQLGLDTEVSNVALSVSAPRECELRYLGTSITEERVAITLLVKAQPGDSCSQWLSSQGDLSANVTLRSGANVRIQWTN